MSDVARAIHAGLVGQQPDPLAPDQPDAILQQHGDAGDDPVSGPRARALAADDAARAAARIDDCRHGVARSTPR